MIPTNKTEHKHLRIKGTSCARKSNENSPKKTRKLHELQEGNQRNHECFHTLGGQILYKIVKKIYAYEAGKREAVRMDGLPINPRAIYMMSLQVGQTTKLPLEHKGRYTPLRGKMVK